MVESMDVDQNDASEQASPEESAEESSVQGTETPGSTEVIANSPHSFTMIY